MLDKYTIANTALVRNSWITSFIARQRLKNIKKSFVIKMVNKIQAIGFSIQSVK